ncbi:metallophosphoesterase family protein [Vibrio paucivorans]|uniref:Metallophosphoesterase n=1 Tax=Vibrio paucivorans TaxID=2829489 RepID=A0A9X3CIA7_9VIBR|nr:metallophosphoesterase [Vibrio paucivorans]MCW8336362.1 metallophosphoesterase [Vibrio paucivorans]
MTTIYQISDCHLGDEKSYRNLARALKLAQADDECTHVLLTGDICCGPNVGSYKKLVRFIDEYIQDKVIIAIAGNHDDDLLMRVELKGSSISMPSKANISGRQFLFLNSSNKPIDNTHPLGSGRLSNRDFATFKKQLRKSTNPVVVIHHPIIRVGSEWMKAICLENDNEVFQALQKHQVEEVICGHGHDEIVEMQQGVTQYMAPSTAYGFDHSVEKYNRTENIGVSRVVVAPDRLHYEAIYL